MLVGNFLQYFTDCNCDMQTYTSDAHISFKLSLSAPGQRNASNSLNENVSEFSSWMMLIPISSVSVSVHGA